MQQESWPPRMNIPTAARYIGVPVATLRYWRHTGQIPIQAIVLSPQTVLYDRADLDRWMESRREPKHA